MANVFTSTIFLSPPPGQPSIPPDVVVFSGTEAKSTLGYLFTLPGGKVTTFSAPTLPTSATSSTIPSTTPSTTPSPNAPLPPITPSTSSTGGSQTTENSSNTTSFISSSSTNSTSSPQNSAGAAASKGAASSNTGFIAAVAVLAAVLLLALVAIVFLLWKRRRGNKKLHDFNNGNFERGNMALKETLLDGENDLSASQASAHELQPMPISSSHRVVGSDLSDKQIHGKFAELSRSINDWTITYFKEFRQPSSLPADTLEMLQRNQPNYGAFLKNPRTKYLVLRALVADILLECFTSGELIGTEDFSHMRDSISAGATPSEMNEWRAMTATLLEKTTWSQRERTASVQEISKRIDDMTSSLAGLPGSEQRLRRLSQIVGSAAGLAIDIAKQRSLVRFAKPQGSLFDVETMEDVLQEDRGDVLRGKPVRMVVFPAVTRHGDDTNTGTNTRKGVTILKSQILL